MCEIFFRQACCYGKYNKPFLSIKNVVRQCQIIKISNNVMD